LSGKHTEAEFEIIDREIHALEGEYDELRAQIRIRSPRYASLTQPRPLTSQDIQDRILDGDTLLLEYALGRDQSHLWVLSKKTLRYFALASRVEIERVAGRFLELLKTRQTRFPGETAKKWNLRVQAADAAFCHTATQLSTMLLGPAAKELAAKRLLIVPDGILQYVPFAALPAPGRNPAQPGSDAPPLVEEFELVTVPSASVLAVLRDIPSRPAAGRGIMIFANPVFASEDGAERKTPSAGAKSGRPPIRQQASVRQGFSLRPLPGTRKETQAILSVVPLGTVTAATGFGATRSRAISAEIGNYKIVHFATHGIMDDAHPKLSGIALSTIDEKGRPQDGLLRLLDIYDMNLPVELVVLSACETALGKDIRGEGLVGLVRGFMYAGAPRVVASLWSVDDDSTAELMKIFYREMFQGGNTAAAALRQAQLEMWRSKRWSAPYYWAGFVLQGEWK
jgi:CHAT domain-containing protein